MPLIEWMLPAKCQSMTQQRLKPQVSDLSWAPWKNSAFLPKLEGEDDDRQHSCAGGAAFEYWSFNVSWRQYITISHWPLLGSSSQFLLCWYLTGARTHLISQVCPSPPATQYLPTTFFNSISVIRGHWITLSTTFFAGNCKASFS